MRGTTRLVLATLFGLGAALAACRKEGDGAAGAGASAEADTGALRGLTPDEIAKQAKPMTPAQAESLGIVDTTIHVEDQGPGDTVRRPPPVLPPAGERTDTAQVKR